MSPLVTIATAETHCDTHYVVCPFAGGGSRTFTSWRKLNLSNESISVMVYAGREARIDEPGIETIESLAKELVQALLASSLPIEKTVIIGHSMGAQVAYEASKQLIQLERLPQGLVISGCQAPHIRGRRLIGDCDDQAFIENLVDMGGCDRSLLDNPQWWSIFLPALRADFTATERYLFPSAPDDQAILSIPTLLISGDRDSEAYFAEVDDWKLWCNEVRDHLVVEGAHFYVTENAQMMIDCLRVFSNELKCPQI